MKRNLLLFVVIGAFLSVFLFSSIYSFYRNKDVFESIEINRFEAVVVVNDDQSINVIETWEMTYDQGYSVRFRDIDFAIPDEYNPNGVEEFNFSMLPVFDDSEASVAVYKNNANITSQIDIGYSFNGDYDELGYPVDCEPHSSFCESIFTGFNSQFRLQNNVKFVYSYKIENAVVDYTDTADLNWSLFGVTESSVNSGVIQIILPDNSLSKNDLNAYSHMSHSDVTILSNNTIRIDFEDLDRDSEAGFRVLMPNAIFSTDGNIATGDWKNSIIELENDLYDDFQREERIERYYKYTPFVLVAVMAFIAYALQLFVFRVKKTTLDQDVTYPPTNISPAVVNYLLNKGLFKKEVITATLLDLCRRGYVEIIDENKNDDEVVFQIKNSLPVADLMGHEQALMHWLFGKDLRIDKVSSVTLEARAKGATDVSDFYNNYRNFVILVENQGKKHNFFNDTLDKRKIYSYMFAIIPLVYMIYSIGISGIYNLDMFLPVTFSLTTIILLYYFISTRSKLTKVGNEAYTKWTAYKKHVVSTKSYDHVDMEDVDYLDELLVFATLFGKADKVMDQLSIDASNPTRTRPPLSQATMNNRNNGYYPYSWYHRRRRHYWYSPWYRTYHRRMPKTRTSHNFFSGGSTRTSGFFSSSGGRSLGGFGGGRSSGGFGGGRSSGGSRGGGGRSR